jgi:hypothetical protein
MGWARTALGDRRLQRNAWGGSVIDSVVGLSEIHAKSPSTLFLASFKLYTSFPNPNSGCYDKVRETI